jgi:uncharacterized protein (UPF0303 family)
MRLFHDLKSGAYKIGKDAWDKRKRTTVRGIMISTMDIEDETMDVSEQNRKATCI